MYFYASPFLENGNLNLDYLQHESMASEVVQNSDFSVTLRYDSNNPEILDVLRFYRWIGETDELAFDGEAWLVTTKPFVDQPDTDLDTELKSYIQDCITNKGMTIDQVRATFWREPPTWFANYCNTIQS